MVRYNNHRAELEIEGYAELATMILNCKHNPAESRTIGNKLIKRGKELRARLINKNYLNFAAVLLK